MCHLALLGVTKMPRNGSGTYTLPQSPFVPSTTISSSAVNSDFSDIATALTGSVAADGQTTLTGALKSASGNASLPSISFASATNMGFYNAGTNKIGVAVGGVAVAQFTASGISNAGGIAVGVPVGTVVDYAGTSAPTGWLLCYGQSLATASYPALFAAIAYTYGGSGPNFTMPDCRGRTTFGKDDMGGVAANRITVAAGNYNATVLGGTGGGQTNALSSTNQLPQFTPSGTVSTPTITVTGTGVTGTAGFGTGGIAAATGAASITASSSTPTFTGNAIGSLSPSSFAVINPSIIFNKIIFAGA